MQLSENLSFKFSQKRSTPASDVAPSNQAKKPAVVKEKSESLLSGEALNFHKPGEDTLILILAFHTPIANGVYIFLACPVGTNKVLFQTSYPYISKWACHT